MIRGPALVLRARPPCQGSARNRPPRSQPRSPPETAVRSRCRGPRTRSQTTSPARSMGSSTRPLRQGHRMAGRIAAAAPGTPMMTGKTVETFQKVSGVSPRPPGRSDGPLSIWRAHRVVDQAVGSVPVLPGNRACFGRDSRRGAWAGTPCRCGAPSPGQALRRSAGVNFAFSRPSRRARRMSSTIWLIASPCSARGSPPFPRLERIEPPNLRPEGMAARFAGAAPLRPHEEIGPDSGTPGAPMNNCAGGLPAG